MYISSLFTTGKRIIVGEKIREICKDGSVEIKFG
jgi:hypothetical protein